MAQRLKVLMVEDNPADAELILLQLRRAGYDPESVCVDTEEDYLAQLESHPEIVLSDYFMPEFDGARALELFKERGLEVPFLIITGSIGEDLAVQVMRHGGATDYLLKDRLARLGEAVKHALDESQLRREQRRSLQRLAESEARLSRLAASAPGAIYAYRLFPDGSSCFDYASPQFEELLGMPLEEVTGDAKFGLARVHPEDQEPLKASLAEAGARMALWSRVFRFVHPRKGVVWLEGRAAPVRESDGSLLFHGFLVDVTERKLLEEQLRQAQKLEAIGQLAGGVAHDFNNLVTVILGHASLLRQGRLSDEEIEGHAEEIERAADRAAALTRQLLLFSRKQVLQPTDLDLNQVVGNMTTMLQRLLGEDVALSTELAPGLPLIHADAGMIEQVLLNLAVNSRDAMPEGGRLHVSTHAAADCERPAAGGPERKPGPYVCLRVADTGSGISADVLPHVFEPFFTTKEVGKGTGLGLATVYGIVQQHEGWLDLKSAPGEGTTFSIGWPASTAGRPEPAAKAGGETVPRGNETVLVVEDEAALRLLVSKVLQSLGYRVLSASSGVGALEVWREHREGIDLLLTDMVMPDGMTGGQLAERLSAEKPELKVVFTSGYSPDLVARGSQLVEGVNFLQKPYDAGKVARILRSLLDQD